MTDASALKAEIEHHFFKNEVKADEGLIEDLLAFVEQQRREVVEEAREALELQLWHSKRMWLHLTQWIDEETKEAHGHYRIAGDKENPFTRCTMMQVDLKESLAKLPPTA